MLAKDDASFIVGLMVLIVVPLVTGCGPTIQSGLEDAQTSMRVKTALLNDPELGTQQVDAEVSGGVVHLSGRVARADQIARAERIVRSVDGVRDVTVALEVGPPELVDRDRPGRLPSIAPPDTDEPLRVLGVGAAGTFSALPGDDLGNGVGYGPVIRLRPRNGWGPSVGFGWTRTPLEDSPDGQPGLADVVVRPVMGGVEYGVSRGRLATGVSLVGGYAFNSLAVDQRRVGPGRAIAVDNSLALRAGVGVWHDITSRVGLSVFAGYRWARPRVTFASDTDITSRRLDADAVMLSVGFAYWLF